jgi:IS30 family transposase
MRGQIPHRRPSSDRPVHIELRKQVGQWECNTFIGANHRGDIVTMVERESGFGAIVKMAHNTSDLVSRAILEGLRHFADRMKTLTYDNGKKFGAHIQIEQALKSTGYFARPFASWERGFKKSCNGLMRQYVPKKRSMRTVDGDEITMIQNRLNNRSRKKLRFTTPSVVLHQSLKRVALRT